MRRTYYVIGDGPRVYAHTSKRRAIRFARTITGCAQPPRTIVTDGTTGEIIAEYQYRDHARRQYRARKVRR